MLWGWFKRLACLGLVPVVALVFVSPVVAENVGVVVGVGPTNVHMTGLTSPGALVTFLENTTVVGSATAAATGAYEHILADQTPGIHTFKVFAQDTAGHVTATATRTISVSEHTDTTLDIFLPPTTRLTQNEITAGSPLTVFGRAPPHATIVAYVGDAHFTTLVSAGGDWLLSIATDGLAAGSHTVRAVALSSGAESESSEEYAFTIVLLAIPPAIVPVATVSKPRPPVITSPLPGAIVVDGVVEVVGAAEPGLQVEVWNRGHVVGSVFSDASGVWRLTLSLQEFANELQARACNGSVCSDLSPPLHFFYNPKTSPGPLIFLDRYRWQAYANTPLNIEVNVRGGKAPYRILLDWGDATNESVVVNGTKVTVAHAYATAGRYNAKIVLIDESAKKAEVYFSVDVIAQVAGQSDISIAVAAVTIAGLCAITGGLVYVKMFRGGRIKG